MKTALVLSLLPVLAFAEPRIETLDRGNAVEIIAHDVTAANMNLIPVRSRLEIQIANKPAPINVPSSDATIVISELDTRTLSVKTAFDRAEVKTLAAHAKAMQVGPDLHIIIPRKIPAAGATIELPEPTMTNVPSIVKVEMPEAAKVEAPKAEAKIEAQPEAAKPDAVAAAPVVETKTAPTADKAPLPTKKEASSPMGKAGMLAMMAMVAIGCGFWLLKKRKKQTSPDSSIEVIAQHSIGAKAKVVWIAAGSREMVLAVTPQGVRMLGSWDKSQSQTTAASDHFAAYTENGKRTRLPTAQVVVDSAMPVPMVDRASPAVAGLLKLRAQTMRPVPQEEELDDDLKTDDVEADAAWAKEILLATRESNNRAQTVRGARR
jgi:flagellar biogenesis protein FliO